MTSSTRQAIACIFATVSVALVSVAAHAQTTPAKEPSGTISGKVTVKGKATAGVNVVLKRNEQSPYRRREGPTYKAVTDAEGNYSITNVPPGQYRIFTVALAFVSENQADRERVLIVGENEKLEHIDFTLARGGVITGKVVDAEGRPVVEEAVYVVYAHDNKFAFPQYNSNTDDRGVYRLYGLRAGSYRVVAGRDENSYMHGVGRTFKQTYYPSVHDPAQATIVEVSEGSETRDIDIVFTRTVTGFTAKGRVVDGETGQPVPNAGYGITRFEQGNTSSRGWGAVTNSRGEFKIDKLSPGTYAISIATPPDADWRVDETRFEIVDRDVNDLVFKTIRSGSISGVVVLEGVDEKKAREELSRMSIMAYIEGSPSQSRASVKVNEDGSFQIRGLAGGTALFYLHSNSSVRLDRVERDGVIHPRSTVIREREHVKGVRVFAQFGNATLRGKIDVENGTLPSDATFHIWPRRIDDEPGAFSSSNARPQVDGRGQFVIEGLAPGSYELNAGVYFASQKLGYIAKKQIVVTANTTTEVDITVDLKSTPIRQP